VTTGVFLHEGSITGLFLYSYPFHGDQLHRGAKGIEECQVLESDEIPRPSMVEHAHGWTANGSLM
jgi:hypothetical protein